GGVWGGVGAGWGGRARLSKARPRSGGAAQMAARGPVGTPPYMSPEQARGDPDAMDERTDVFGLGAILYQIVSGQVPYGRTNDVQEILDRALAGRTVPIDEAVGQRPLARRIRAIVTQGIAAEP